MSRKIIATVFGQTLMLTIVLHKQKKKKGSECWMTQHPITASFFSLAKYWAWQAARPIGQ